MKKTILFLMIFVFPFLCKSFSASAKEASVPFSMEDVSVDFSSEGYMPSAKCENEEIASLISYFAIDTKTSSPVQLPLTAPGTYQVFAVFSGNESYEKAEAASFVTINPIEAKIITNYRTVAYSRMENPIKYSVEPKWAEEFLDISIDYFPIESLDSYSEEKIDVPVNIGMYYTVFNVKSKTDGISCENKYMIYEIAAYRGKKLSSKERAASVQSTFKCTFQNLNTTYEENKPVSVQYTLSPAAISGEVLYKKVHSDGTHSAYTSEIPIQPGEYICGYFLGSTCIGEGKIFIDKQEVFITIEDETREFVSSGIVPTAQCENKNVKIAFTAFALDENGNVTMEEVSVPIKKCGKYSIIAYPENTEFFKRTYSYAYVEIVPATPKITVTETEFIYDGKPKNIGFYVFPGDAYCTVEYYKWEEKESGIPLGTSPKGEGKYLAVITSSDKDGNYNTVSKSAIMYIQKSNEKNSFSKGEIILLSLLSALLAGALTTGAIFSIKALKKKKG